MLTRNLHPHSFPQRPGAGLGWVVLCLALAACSGTSLNEAPVTDLSTPTAARAALPAPAKPAAPVVVDADTYSVQKGDTLYRIAATYHCSVSDLMQWNGLDSTKPIRVGQILRIHAPAPVPAAPMAPAAPGADAATPAEAVAHAVPVPTGSSVEVRPLAEVSTSSAPLTVPAAADAPALKAGAATGSAAIPAAGADPRAAGSGAAADAPWIWPVQGHVVRGFNAAQKSLGVEIAVSEDAPVRAVADGSVIYTGSPRDYGNLIILRHGAELLSVYAHLKSLRVAEGQSVRQGDLIATSGSTDGGSPGMHFEVRRNHLPVDPLGQLPPSGAP